MTLQKRFSFLLGCCAAIALGALYLAGAVPGGDAAPASAATPTVLVATEVAAPVFVRPTALGKVAERTFNSASLGRTMPYTVYTPPGYEENSGLRYPVLYMLHGLGGDRGTWQRFGLLQAADRLILTGEISPMIIVLPEGERSYWVDHANGGPRWGQYVARDLVSEVDANFRTIPLRIERAIGGVSMGGHGALQLALNNLDVFGIAGAHSVALREFAIAPGYFGDRLAYSERDPVSISKRDPARAQRLRLWIDIGSEDFWSGRAKALHEQLKADGVRHEWRMWPGGHTAEYTSAHVEDYLRYYSAMFNLRDLNPA